MAGYACAICEGDEQATILITPLTGGETVALGPSCAAVGLIGITAGILGTDADALYAAVEKHMAAQQRRQEKAQGDGKGEAPPRRSRAPRAAQTAAGGQAGGAT